MNPKNYSCPSICPESEKAFDITRREFCETCPKRKAKDKFRKKTLEYWDKRVGSIKARQYRFDDVLALLFTIVELEKAPKDQISVKEQALLDAYIIEREKAEAIRTFNSENNS